MTLEKNSKMNIAWENVSVCVGRHTYIHSAHVGLVNNRYVGSSLHIRFCSNVYLYTHMCCLALH